MPKAETWADVEREIKRAVEQGILVDKRDVMPRGRRSDGTVRFWAQRQTPADVLGHCIHQNGSPNFTRPLATAGYHTSAGNHIGKDGAPLPSVVYAIMIPGTDDPPWLCCDLQWITWAQGAHAAGDENRHLIPVLVMGGFEDDGFRRAWTKQGPSAAQWTKLLNVMTWLSEVFGYGLAGYFGHHHFGKSNCPGRFLRQKTETFRLMAPDLISIADWQHALLRWEPSCLPRWGADGVWGGETKVAVAQFQRSHGLRVTAWTDPFSELLLLQKYPELP